MNRIGMAKERIGGKVKRRYDTPKTPSQRLRESDRIDPQTKEELTRIYQSLNPAALKRAIPIQCIGMLSTASIGPRTTPKAPIPSRNSRSV